MLVMTKLRMEKGWSIYRLAQEAHVNRTSINAHELGKTRYLHPSMAFDLARALDVSVFDIAKANGNRLVHREI